MGLSGIFGRAPFQICCPPGVPPGGPPVQCGAGRVLAPLSYGRGKTGAGGGIASFAGRFRGKCNVLSSRQPCERKGRSPRHRSENRPGPSSYGGELGPFAAYFRFGTRSWPFFFAVCALIPGGNRIHSGADDRENAIDASCRAAYCHASAAEGDSCPRGIRRFRHAWACLSRVVWNPTKQISAKIAISTAHRHSRIRQINSRICISFGT